MLDQHHGDLELVADLDDVVHQVGGLGGVHARRGLVEQKELGIGRERAHDLQAALGAVWQRACDRPRLVGHAEDIEQLQRALVELLLARVVARGAEDAVQHGALDLVVQADADVVLHAQAREEADVLEGARDARLVDLGYRHARRVLPVQKDGAVRRLVHLGQQVEDGRLARAVGADQARDLGLAHCEVELLDGVQAAEVDPQVAGLEHGLAIDVALRDDRGRGYGHHLGVHAALLHAAFVGRLPRRGGFGLVTHRHRPPLRSPHCCRRRSARSRPRSPAGARDGHGSAGAGCAGRSWRAGCW